MASRWHARASLRGITAQFVPRVGSFCAPFVPVPVRRQDTRRAPDIQCRPSPHETPPAAAPRGIARDFIARVRRFRIHDSARRSRRRVCHASGFRRARGRRDRRLRGETGGGRQGGGELRRRYRVPAVRPLPRDAHHLRVEWRAVTCSAARAAGLCSSSRTGRSIRSPRPTERRADRLQRSGRHEPFTAQADAGRPRGLRRGATDEVSEYFSRCVCVGDVAVELVPRGGRTVCTVPR